MSSFVLTVLVVPAGASFTDTTVMPALAMAVENAVAPPLVLVLAVAPAVPLLMSQARNVIPVATVALKLAFGTNRTELNASAASSRAVAAPGVPNALHAPPPLVVYCQAPLLLSTAVTAMPEAAPASASATCPAISADTSVPLLLPEATSSLMLLRLFAPESTGASLTAPTFTASVLAEASRSMPPLAVPPPSCTWNVKLA